MAIPTFLELMRPFLLIIQNGAEFSVRTITQELTQVFSLTPCHLEERVSSGQSKFVNRVAWAKSYLKKAGLIEDTRRGHCRITSQGLAAIEERHDPFDFKFLAQFEGIREFHFGNSRGTRNDIGSQEANTKLEVVQPPILETPEEGIDRLIDEIQGALIEDLLEAVKGCSPAFFERLVVKLLVKMGYGGFAEEGSQVVGRSGDGGIDGIIKQDPLGLDNVYIQAKRWEGSVGSPEIQKFVGALAGKKAKKGVFITTSDFTSAAKEYVKTTGFTVVLVNGFELAELLIQHDVGVSVKAVKFIKRIDNDYFTEE